MTIALGEWAHRENIPQKEAYYCDDWLKEALGKTLFLPDKDTVYWAFKYDAKVKEQLERLRQIAEQAIEWV